MMIQPFVENAIIHGIAALEIKGHININIQADDDYLICEITDNGIGVNASREKNKNRIHHSTGIKISADRIKLYAGDDSEKNLQITENKTVQGIVCGTTVRFRIKKENLW
jgi:sensor histidine kinase YesM